MLLIPVFLLLLAGWVLWAWCVAEHRDWKWLRIICARAFILIVFIVGGGIGVLYTRLQLKSQHRAQVQAFSTEVRAALITGRQQELLEQLDVVIDPPEEWSDESWDILERVAAVTERLQPPIETELGLETDDPIQRLASESDPPPRH